MTDPGDAQAERATRFRWSADVVALAVAFAVDLAVAIVNARRPGIWRIDASLAIALAGAVATIVPPARLRGQPYRLVLALLALPAIAVFNPRVGLTGLVLVVVLEIRCTFAFGLRGTALVGAFAAAMLAIGIAAQLPARQAIVVFLIVLALFGAVFGLVAVLTNALRSERAAKRALEAAHEELRTYAARAAEVAMIEERSRLAFDLHDALGHGLTTLSVQLQSAERLRGHDDAKADAFLRTAAATTLSLLAELRETVGMLRRNEGASDRFSTDVQRLLSDFSQTGLLDVTANVAVAREPDRATGLMLLRVVQEALTNVARHASARQLRASVIGNAEQIIVTIEDDGRGFDPESDAAGVGLRSMRERLARLGGAVTIDSRAGGGTTVHAVVPLAPP